MNNSDKAEQIKQGFDYIKTLIDTIEIKGVENCQKITTICNNVSVFLKMLETGEISIIDTKNAVKGQKSTKSQDGTVTDEKG